MNVTPSDVLAGLTLGTHEWHQLSDREGCIIGPSGRIVARLTLEPEPPPDPDLGEPEG